MSRHHRCTVEARSYEMDSFGHLNHAVFLNWFELGRFQTLHAGGFSPERVTARGEGIHVVRVEIDYRSEVLLGDRVTLVTALEEMRNSSMTLRQVAHREGDPEHVHAEARVVVVWVGPDRRPMRIPQDARKALS
jgi:YbgC/YbaW family acyl-CoA thioester hydrolase